VIARYLDPPDGTVRPPGTVEIAALHLRSVALHGEGRGDAGVVTEVHREPAIEARRLPVARAPGSVAQPVAVDRPGAVADRDPPGRVPVLLEMPARELLPRPLRPHADPAA